MCCAEYQGWVTHGYTYMDAMDRLIFLLFTGKGISLDKGKLPSSD